MSSFQFLHSHTYSESWACSLPVFLAAHSIFTLLSLPFLPNFKYWPLHNHQLLVHSCIILHCHNPLSSLPACPPNAVVVQPSPNILTYTYWCRITYLHRFRHSFHPHYSSRSFSHISSIGLFLPKIDSHTNIASKVARTILSLASSHQAVVPVTCILIIIINTIFQSSKHRKSVQQLPLSNWKLSSRCSALLRLHLELIFCALTPGHCSMSSSLTHTK